MDRRRPAAAQPQGAAFFPVCGCGRARGAAAEPSESYEDAADVDPSRISHRSASSRGSGGTDSKTLASLDSEVHRRQEQRPYPRLMVSAARAVGVHIEGRQRAAGAVAAGGRGRGQSPWARALNFSGFAKKAMSFENALGAGPRWRQFASWETVMGPNRLPVVREVIKVNLRPASNQHPEDPRDAVVKQLLAKPAHFPHGVHTIELTCCDIETVPSTIAGHGELKVLRLSKNAITELPKSWLGPETKASRSRSNTSLGSRAASGISSWASWIATRSRSLSPSFCSPASARGARRRSSPRRWSPRGSPSRPRSYSAQSSRRRRRSSSGDSTPGDEAGSSPRRRSVEELSPRGGLDMESRPEGGTAALPAILSARREGPKDEQSSPRASPVASPSAASLSPTSLRDSPRTARKSALKDTSSPVVNGEKRKVKLTLRARSEKSPPPKSPSAHSSLGTGKSSARCPTTPLSTFTRRSQRKGTDRSGESGRSGRSWMSRVSVFLTGRQKWQRPALQELRLDRNAIAIVERGALGSAIARGLTILDLAHNRLSSLPPDFLEGCRSLRYLDLSFNQLDEVPQLTEEHLCHEDESAEEDSAEGEPAGRGEPKSLLEILLLDSNRLRKLPDKLPHGLRRLSASYNGLTELPEHIGNLRQLESLRLASNKIRALPPSAIHLWPGKRSGGRLSHLQIEDNPLVQPSITAFQLGGMDAAFDLFDQWLSGKEAKPAPHSTLAALPPLWATSLESVRFPGFFLGGHDGSAFLATRAATGVHSAPPSMRMREYAGDVVSLEADASRGRLATAGGGDDEYREVILAPVKEGLEASSHFRMRAFPDGLVTFESMGFPGFFLNVYGSKESHKSVQLVLDEPSNPHTQSWGFFRMGRARISSAPLGEPREHRAAGSRPPRLERDGEDDDRALSPLSAASNKRRSISPVRTLIHGINSIRRLTISNNAPSVTGAASNKEGAGRAAIHTNSVRSGSRSRSPTAGSRQRRE